MCVLWILETALGCGLQYVEKEVQMFLDTQISELISVLRCSSGNQHYA